MSSSCAHCNAVEQRGRYCVGCGKLMPPSQLPSRRVRLARRPLRDATTPSRCSGSATPCRAARAPGESAAV